MLTRKGLVRNPARAATGRRWAPLTGTGTSGTATRPYADGGQVLLHFGQLGAEVLGDLGFLIECHTPDVRLVA